MPINLHFVTKESSSASVLICWLAETALWIWHRCPKSNEHWLGCLPTLWLPLSSSVGSFGSCQNLPVGCQFWVGPEQEKSCSGSRLCHKLPCHLDSYDSAHPNILKRSVANRDAVWSFWQSLIRSLGFKNKSCHLLQTIYYPFESSCWGWNH